MSDPPGGRPPWLPPEGSEQFPNHLHSSGQGAAAVAAPGHSHIPISDTGLSGEAWLAGPVGRRARSWRNLGSVSLVIVENVVYKNDISYEVTRYHILMYRYTVIMLVVGDGNAQGKALVRKVAEGLAQRLTRRAEQVDDLVHRGSLMFFSSDIEM